MTMKGILSEHNNNVQKMGIKKWQIDLKPEQKSQIDTCFLLLLLLFRIFVPTSNWYLFHFLNRFYLFIFFFCHSLTDRIQQVEVRPVIFRG